MPGYPGANKGKITNRPAWMTNCGGGLGIGHSGALKKAINMRASAKCGCNQCTKITCVNVLSGGVGRGTGQFGPTADGANCGNPGRQRGRIVSRIYCGIPAAVGGSGENECSITSWTLGNAYVRETAPKQYHVYGTPEDFIQAKNAGDNLAHTTPAPYINGQSISLMMTADIDGVNRSIWGVHAPVQLLGTNPTNMKL